ncbi:MAG: hypothetical protein HOC23_09300, partial [Halieaceae bacterium]|nr:hypothetical protein [Halieaceae bacterium]
MPHNTHIFAVSLVIYCLFQMTACSKAIEPIDLDMGDKVTLSDGNCPIIHCNSYQSDALPLKGPEKPSQKLDVQTIDHLWSSPIAGGILDHTYQDGTTVFWVSQVDRIMKLRLNQNNRLEKITEMALTPKDFPRFEPEVIQSVVRALDDATVGSEHHSLLAGEWKGYQIEGLRAYYAMVNNHGILYVGNRDSVIAYGDEEPGNPNSRIVKVGQYGFQKSELQLGLTMPTVIMIGMNVTPDGYIITVTIDGTVVAIAPDLSTATYYPLQGEQIWNSVAVDDHGAIYVAGTKRLHKLIWKNKGFSDKAEDGAWVEPYSIGSLDAELRAERGSGTTPALMGSSSDSDRFVVIADAENVNNIVFYWRDKIPRDWKQLPGARSRRVAGILPVDFGDNSLTNSYSENSATIFEYGAVLGNNQVKTNEPMTMDVQLKMKDPARTPYGIQKFQWNSDQSRL